MILRLTVMHKVIFIACQNHTWHAERNSVLPFLSVCLSRAGVSNECTYRHTLLTFW